MNKENLYFMDFETGGLKAYVNGVCSCFIKKYQEQGEYFLFYPQKAVYDVSAFNVNGFTFDELYRKGESRDKLVKYFDMLCEDKQYIIISGWNIGFDIDFLLQIYKIKKQRIKCPILSFDLMEIAKKNIKKKDKRKKVDDGIEDYKLTTVYKYLFDDFEESKAHNAEYDVIMVERVYDKFVELGYIEK